MKNELLKELKTLPLVLMPLARQTNTTIQERRSQKARSILISADH